MHADWLFWILWTDLCYSTLSDSRAKTVIADSFVTGWVLKDKYPAGSSVILRFSQVLNIFLAKLGDLETVKSPAILLLICDKSSYSQFISVVKSEYISEH